MRGESGLHSFANSCALRMTNTQNVVNLKFETKILTELLVFTV